MRLCTVAWTGRMVCLILIASVAALGSCTEDTSSDLPFAPQDCVTQEPNVGPFEVLTTITTEFRSVSIKIFEGDFEDNIVVVEDTVTTRSNTYQLFTEKHYSAAAQYVIGVDTVLVIDGDKIDKSREEFRDRDCWSMEAGLVDLQLRVRP